jgi:thiol:disulfide interchange protein DsbD
MIPITVSFFLKQSQKEHHRPLLFATVYTLTIIIVLAFAAIFLLTTFKFLSQHWLTNLVIAGLFVFFALNLFGMYEIELPSGLARYTSAREGQGGMIGTVFMALTFTIVSFACVAPFMGAFAGLATQSRAWYELGLGGLAYATAFASPFFFLALFPSLLKAMPRSGSWLNTVKVVMGFLELAAAIKFLRAGELLFDGEATFLTFELSLGLYVALGFLCGLYLLNLFRLPHDSPVEHLGIPRMLFSLVFIALSFYLLPGLTLQRPNGKIYAWLESFLLPDTTQSNAVAQGGNRAGTAPGYADLKWRGNMADALKLAAESKPQKRVFIDFTGVG